MYSVKSMTSYYFNSTLPATAIPLLNWEQEQKKISWCPSFTCHTVARAKKKDCMGQLFLLAERYIFSLSLSSHSPIKCTSIVFLLKKWLSIRMESVHITFTGSDKDFRRTLIYNTVLFTIYILVVLVLEVSSLLIFSKGILKSKIKEF